MSDAPDSSVIVEQLADLRDSPGFAILCAHFQKERDALRDTAMTTKDDDEANRLRRLHQKLNEFSPAEMLAVLQTNYRNAAKRETPVVQT